MEYRRFGKTDKRISVITLGGMRYPQGWDSPRDVLPRDSLETCYNVTRMALESGINHIETAHGYGKSENLYGRTLEELNPPRDSLYIMTKGTAENADTMRAKVEQQLEALRIDRIDFYGYHGINTADIMHTVIEKNGPIDGLEMLRDEGLIGHIGFSTHAPLDVILETIMTDRFEFVNLHYYYFFQRNFPAIALARHKDMGVFIISPNDKGGQLWNPSRKLTDACKPITPLQFNGRFCLSHPGIHTMSFGINNVAMFAEDLGVLNDNLYLSADDLKIKTRLDAMVNDLDGTYCTGCWECLPCPENITIPEVLRFRNMALAWDMVSFGKYRYNMLEAKNHWFPGRYADACTECGECLPRCPVHLNIPALLSETHRLLKV